MLVKTLGWTQQLSRYRVWLAVLLSAGLCFAASTARAIVGYVNVELTNGYTFVANPLDNPPNVLTNVVVPLPVGSRAYFWDVTNQVFLPTATRGVSGWDRNYDFPVGRGAVLYVPTRSTNTFVGTVLQGFLTNAVAGSNKFSLLGCMLPISGPLSQNVDAPGFPRIDGATVHFHRNFSQSFPDGFTCFTNYGWADPKGVESTNGPILAVAQGFFVQNPGPPTNWVRIFTNSSGPITGPAMVKPQVSELEIQQVSVQDGSVTFTIPSGDTVFYNIQFSTDGATWTTVAANQTGTKWTGPLPDPVQGQFQVVTSQREGGAK